MRALAAVRPIARLRAKTRTVGRPVAVPRNPAVVSVLYFRQNTIDPSGAEPVSALRSAGERGNANRLTRSADQRRSSGPSGVADVSRAVGSAGSLVS